MDVMRILVTNDDGIESVGLAILVQFAKKLGDVIVVAPKFEQSAMSHALKIKGKIECMPIDKGFGVPTYYVDSTPADCVRYAYYGLEEKFDYVFSGINRGYNVGEDIMYSGTVAAATEAATLGKKSLAFSTSHNTFNGSEKCLDIIWDYLSKNELLDLWNLYNINFDSEKANQVIITKQGDCNFQTSFEKEGNDYYQRGIPCFESSVDKMYLDTSSTMNGYISITPLEYNRTNEYIYNKLKK